MKILKIPLLIIAMVIVFSGFAGAQNKMTPEDKATKYADKLKTKLNLTDEQYNKVYSLQLDKIKQLVALKEEQKKLKQSQKQTMKDYRSGLKQTLNDDQMKKLRRMEKNKMHKMEKHYKGGKYRQNAQGF